MLSILIPTYNYNVYPLVSELHKQCLECEIDFEIIVIDDGSKLFFNENQEINSFKNCRFEILEKNIGRSGIGRHRRIKIKINIGFIFDCLS